MSEEGGFQQRLVSVVTVTSGGQQALQQLTFPSGTSELHLKRSSRIAVESPLNSTSCWSLVDRSVLAAWLKCSLVYL